MVQSLGTGTVDVEALVAQLRRGHRHPTGWGQHLAFAVISIAEDPSAAVLVELIGELLGICSGLSLQGRFHICRAPGDNLIEQRPTDNFVLLLNAFRVVNY